MKNFSKNIYDNDTEEPKKKSKIFDYVLQVIVTVCISLYIISSSIQNHFSIIASLWFIIIVILSFFIINILELNDLGIGQKTVFGIIFIMLLGISFVIYKLIKFIGLDLMQWKF